MQPEAPVIDYPVDLGGVVRTLKVRVRAVGVRRASLRRRLAVSVFVLAGLVAGRTFELVDITRTSPARSDGSLDEGAQHP